MSCELGRVEVTFSPDTNSVEMSLVLKTAHASDRG